MYGVERGHRRLELVAKKPGFPPRPPMGFGYGAMPSMGTPGASMSPGTPMAPSHPPGYVPSFTAPASLPVLPKSTPP